VTKISKDDALLYKDLSQSDYDMLLCNLKIEPGVIKDFNLEWKCEVCENLTALGVICIYQRTF
jgi:hypothetical protein